MNIRNNNLFRTLPAAVIAGSLLATGTGVSAQTLTSDTMHFYIGGNYGSFKSRGGEFEDENDFAEAVAGLKINRYLGVEGSYTNFGEFGDSFTTATLGGWGLSALGSLPISETTSLYAKAGMFFSQLDVEFAGFDEGYSDQQPFYGVGVNFAVFDPVMLSVEYDRYKVEIDDGDELPLDFDTSNTDIDTVKLGFKFMF